MQELKGKNYFDELTTKNTTLVNATTNPTNKLATINTSQVQNMRPSYTIYYWKYKPNVGDYYGYWLLKHLFTEVDFTWADKNVDIVSTGSILCHKAISDTTYIAGCGKHNIDDWEKFSGDKNRVLGVRGKLSRDYLNISELPMADPGLLVSSIYNKAVPVTHKFGLICHIQDYDFFKRIYGNNIFLINMQTNNVEGVIDQIRSCEFIFSSSLHGLIFSHAYGIPAVHIKALCKESRGNFKFKDYYSVLDVNYEYIDYDANFNFNDFYTKAKNNFRRYCPSAKSITAAKLNILAMYKKLEQKLPGLTLNLPLEPLDINLINPVAGSI